MAFVELKLFRSKVRYAPRYVNSPIPVWAVNSAVNPLDESSRWPSFLLVSDVRWAAPLLFKNVLTGTVPGPAPLLRLVSRVNSSLVSALKAIKE